MQPIKKVTKGEKANEKTVDKLKQNLTFMKKEPVVLKKDIKGFLSNRLQFALLREATYLVEKGANGISTGLGFYEYDEESSYKEECNRDYKMLHFLNM